MATGINSTAAPIASTGVPGVAPTTGAVQPAAAQQALPASQLNPTGYDATPVTGGGFLDTISNAVQTVGASVATSLAAFASKEMSASQARMQAKAQSEGKVDPADLQLFSAEMARHEMTMQMAAKIQEKEERLASVWLR